MRHSVIVALTLFTLPVRTAERPNIVVILADDMGFSDLACYGGEIATPNLDALAANGLRFTQFYNTARCCPTRASLLTGLYPHQAGVGHMMENKSPPGYTGDLSPKSLTIAEALKPAGYRAYAVGKWHVTRYTNPNGPKHNWPIQRGFERCYCTINGGGSYYDPSTLVRDNTMISPQADPDYKPERFYYTNAIGEHAVRFIADHHRDHATDPMFMYVAFTAAHWPMQAFDEDIAKYRGKYDRGYEPIRKARYEWTERLGLINPKWQMSPQAEDWNQVKDKAWESRCMEVYAAMVTVMDANVGRIVAELKRTGQLDNTLVLFLQDNGACAETTGRAGNKVHPDIPRPEKPTLPTIPLTELRGASAILPQTRDGYPVRMGTHAMPGPPDTFVAYGRGWANVSNTPFREYKHWVHEGGISTPLIAHWPAGITVKNELRHQPGHLIDIMATCLDLAGTKCPEERQGQPVPPPEGRSLVPAFAGKVIERDALFWEHEGNRALRVGDWKLVAKAPAGKWELYDMAEDRTELHDLAAKQSEKVKEMTAKWETFAKRTHVLPWIWTPAYKSTE